MEKKNELLELREKTLKIQEKQKKCIHPLWYLLREEVDDYHSLKSYWKCRCLECEKENFDRPRWYKGKVLYNNYSRGYKEERLVGGFREVQKRCFELKKIGKEFGKKFDNYKDYEEIGDTLVNEFSTQKQKVKKS